MICRRRLHRLRTRNTLVISVVIALFLGIILTYKTLNGQHSEDSQYSSLPTFGKRKPRYQAAQFRLKLLNDRFQQRANYSEHFKSGLKVNEVKEVLMMLYPDKWKITNEADEMAILLKDKMLALNLQSPITCKDIDIFRIQGHLKSSGRKFVDMLEVPESMRDSFNSSSQQGKMPRLMVAKSQAHDIQTKIACMNQINKADFCEALGSLLLLREIFLLRFFNHSNLIGLLGYCLRGNKISVDMQGKGLVLVLEGGMPLNSNLIASLSWSHRVKLALGIAYLLEYLESSPLGSVGLPHIELKDFVVVDNKYLKLTDLDDAELEEKNCIESSDCFLRGTEFRVECQSGQCLGLNQKTTLRSIGGAVLDPLLQEMPPNERLEVKEMLRRIQSLEMTSKELINFLETLVEKSSGNEVFPHDEELYQKQRDENGDLEEEFGAVEKEKKGSEIFQKKDHAMVKNPQPERYLRVDASNFPGQYDYPCADSRVLWGCVMTFETLEAAMSRCSADSACKAFVVFSTLPERENKMTVVFKISGTGSPHVNLGTTLFIKKKEIHSEPDQLVVKNGGVDSENSAQERVKKVEEEQGNKQYPLAKVLEVQNCIKQSQEMQKAALLSRQKRLMAHMGLKETQEKYWKYAVKVQTVLNYTNLRALPTKLGAKGGSFLLHFKTTNTKGAVKQAKFIVEKGQKRSHIAFALLYHIDRLLGLYHTPPAVKSFIPAPTVKQFASDRDWESTFGSLTDPNGTLTGLFVAPTPRVVKKSVLLLEPLPEMVSEVTAFDRTMKLQLEYILLWWLGHIAKSTSLHRGFKGHLIHIDGDQAFQETTANFEGYFNHCQFPNVVYKMLMCFRCHQGTANKICFLGQEVIRRLEATGFKLHDLQIQDNTEQDYLALIDEAASRTIEIVDKCIQEFSREVVLY